MEDKIKHFLFTLSELIILTTFFMFFIAQTFLIKGFSMEPTLKNGQRILVEKVSLFLGGPKQGDIIIFQNPKNKEQILIKRVIGVGGDEIIIENSTIFVNGKLLKENYITEPLNYPRYLSYQVPKGHVFVLGDNRNHSSDSRFLGAVPKKNIIGRTIFIYWPFRDLSVFFQP